MAHSTRRLIESHRLDLLRNITDLLGRTFSSQFVFPVLGHEDGQGNSFRRLGELWRHWLPSEALQTFEKGMCVHFIDKRKLIFDCLKSRNLYENENIPLNFVLSIHHLIGVSIFRRHERKRLCLGRIGCPCGNPSNQ